MIKVKSIHLRYFIITCNIYKNKYSDVTQEERDNARAYLSNLHLQSEPSISIPSINVQPQIPDNNNINHTPQIHQPPQIRPHAIQRPQQPPKQTYIQPSPSYPRQQSQSYNQPQNNLHQQQQYIEPQDHHNYYTQHPKELPQSTKENILLAVFALLNELDNDGLTVVRKQLDKMSKH